MFLSYAVDDGYDSYALNVASWTPETYLNAPQFDHTNITLAGVDHSVLGYTLPTTKEEQYSMEASLLSPALSIPANNYVFRFSFYTCMRADTPHEVTLYYREENEEFLSAGSFICTATGDEFLTGEIELTAPFTYLKLEIRTFYSYNDESDHTDRGIYFRPSDFLLVAPKADVYRESDFTFLYDSFDFTYNGKTQRPSVTVRTELAPGTYACDIESHPASDLTSPTDSIDAGNYTLSISVRNRSNFVCFTVTKNYTIEKASLTVNAIEYVSNDNVVVVLNADVTDEEGRRVSAEELGLTYFTSTVNGRRVESVQPVLSRPNENFSVGITVTSDNFNAPTENTYVDVTRNFGTAPVFYIEKNKTYDYCGKAIDVTKDAFFTTTLGSVTLPSSFPTLAYFDEEGNTVAEIKSTGIYRCVITYQSFTYEVNVTVNPRPIVAYLYCGPDLIKYYDGTTDIFDPEQDTVFSQISAEELVAISDPDFGEENGVIRTADVNDIVTIRYSSASFARSIGNTYLVLNDPYLSGINAPDYYLHPDFHIISAVRFDENVYEKTGEIYTRTTDPYYQEGSAKEYYYAEFALQSTAPGEPIVGKYYEKDNTVFFPTEDTIFDNKDYYQATPTPIDNIVLSIKQTEIIFKSDRDDKDNVVTCRDKRYVPGDTTAEHSVFYYRIYSEPNDWITSYTNYYTFSEGNYIANTSSTWMNGTAYYYASAPQTRIPIYGYDDSLPYVDFSFTFADANVGTHELTVTLANKTLYDRYLPGVITPLTLYGNIVPAPLTINAARADEFIENRDKVYDGSFYAYPQFTDLILTGTKPDGFPAFDQYTVSFRSATYNQVNVGTELSLTISGITVTGLTDTARSYLNNYSFSSLVVTGSITPKELEIYSETIRVYAKVLPNVLSNAESDSDLSKRIYSSLIDAENGGADIHYTATVPGNNYYLRIDCTSANYTLPSPYYKILPMNVVDKEMTRQKIVFPGLDLSLGTEFTVLMDSVLSLTAISVEEDSRLSTGLEVQCVLADPDNVFEVSGGVWTAKNEGTATLTATQNGEGRNGRYYYAADPVTLTFTVSSKRVIGESTVTGLFAGNTLPTLDPSEYTLHYNDGTPSGNLVPSDAILAPSERGEAYTYYFTSNPTLTEFVADFSTGSQTYYVKDSTEYEAISGIYSPYESYYVSSYKEQAVTANQPVPHGTYYEYDYVPLSETETSFVAGKDYYVRYYFVDSSVVADSVVPIGVYYELQKGYYYKTTDSVFSAQHTYYAFSLATFTPGDPIPAGIYYEKISDTMYALTSDTLFEEEKEYYLCEEADVEAMHGDAIEENAEYYMAVPDSYYLTEDLTFDGDKTYYRIGYRLDTETVHSGAPIPRSADSATYYEVDMESYHLTYDSLFQSGKKYYVISYTQVFFISAGDLVDVELYYEKGENNTPLTLNEGDAFSSNKKYFLTVWTAQPVTDGDPIPDGWYLKKDLSYSPTTDVVFISGKTYYLKLYTALSGYSVDDPIEGILFERIGGVYVQSDDTTYQGGKKYYSLSYVEAVVDYGANVNGKEYYELDPDEFEPATGYFDGNKTYYTKSYVDVLFLNGQNLPDGNYYHPVSTYEKSTDLVFRRDVVYYKGSYVQTEVVPGTYIRGQYYLFNSSTRQFEPETGSFFRYDTSYYRLSLSPENVLEKYYRIDPFNQYYTPATGIYMSGISYYVFNDGEMVVDDSVTIGTMVDSQHYVLVTEEEFEHNKTYYCLSYPFIGQAPVDIFLSAQKPIVTVYTKSRSSALYGESTDPFDLVEKITVYNGTTHLVSLTDHLDELRDYFNLELRLAQTDGSSETITSDDQVQLPPGDYIIENNQRESYLEETVYLQLTTLNSSFYQFTLADGFTTHTVNKNKITVSVAQQNKYYGENIPSDENVLRRLQITGCNAELADNIRDNLDVSTQAYSYSKKGEYPIHISVKALLAVDTPIPDGIYYVAIEDDVTGEVEYTLLTGNSGNFVGGVTYYILTYQVATVTPGDEIDPTRYYVLNNDTYIPPYEDTFVEGKTYYVLDYEPADVYQGHILSYWEDYYDFVFIQGYLSVDPISVSVGAYSTGHDYGNNVAEITPTVSVLSDARLTEEELETLRNEVLVDITTRCNVTSSSDSGEYPIIIYYNGNNENIRVTAETDCLYPVHYARLNANPESPSFVFNDASVLYDGNLHSITVTYNTRLWPSVTIVYDKGKFSEIGNYVYTATISQKNYEDLVLSATMSICTLNIRSSNQINNSVIVSITDPSCYNGVNGDYTVLLRKISDEEKIESINELIAEKEKSYTLQGVYTIQTYVESTESPLGYTSYTITVSPSSITYKDNLQIYGYSEGEFKKLKYTYQNGTYTFSVSSNILEDSSLDPLSCFAFVETKEVTAEGVEYKWVFIAIIGVVLLLIIGIVLSAVSKSGKGKTKSRKRHHRWV